jgi:ankyrin repeat protein
MRLLDEHEAEKRRVEFIDALYAATLSNDLARAEQLLTPHIPAAQPTAGPDGTADSADSASGAAAPAAASDASWDFVDSHGWAPLHWAAARGFDELSMLLLDAGSDVRAYHRRDGRTPLHRAAEGGHAQMAQLLLKRGASAGAATTDGDTPLHLAALNGHVECMRVLLEAEPAGPSVLNRQRMTPLAVAASGARSRACSLLLEAGADLEAADENGWRPLHHAAAVREPIAATLVCALLVGAGADTEALTLGKRRVRDLCAADAIAAAIDESAALRYQQLAVAEAEGEGEPVAA